jgi:ATP-binding cassette, subfamily B, multidrug efflux pump
MLKEYRTLLPLVKQYRGHYFAGVLCLVVTSGGQILIPQFVRQGIDIVTQRGFTLSQLVPPLLMMIGVAVVISIARFGWRYFIHGASRRIEAKLRRRLFSHLLTLSGSFYRERQSGDLMARATNDMQAIRMASGMALVAAIDGVFMTLAILWILFQQNPRIAALTILPLPLVTVLILSAGRIVSRLFKQVQEGFSDLSEEAREAIAGVRVIKAFVKEQYFLKKFGETNREYQRRNLAYVRLWGLFFPLVIFLSGLTTLLLLRFGGAAVIRGTLTPGEFVATMSYLEMLIWPMLGVGFTVNMIARGAASLKRINEILDVEPEITPVVDPPVAVGRAHSHTLEARSLSYRYPGMEVDALADVSFRLEPGSSLGILGTTGSGKSTLMWLLPRLLDPPEGTLFLNGKDIRTLDLAELRSVFGIVAQETFLFSATISENIAYAAPNATEERIREMAEISTISRDLDLFPDGIDTQVGERGVSLSGGQKQRIDISRVLATDPEILLFDDALSAVDTESEEIILRRLEEQRKDKTNIVVSHRVSTLQFADEILVFDQGHVIQQGTPESLAKAEGLYRRIAALQSMERRVS